MLEPRHYPDYFPARRASLMKEVVQELRDKHNVHTIPYVSCDVDVTD